MRLRRWGADCCHPFLLWKLHSVVCTVKVAQQSVHTVKLLHWEEQWGETEERRGRLLSSISTVKVVQHSVHCESWKLHSIVCTLCSCCIDQSTEMRLRGRLSTVVNRSRLSITLSAFTLFPFTLTPPHRIVLLWHGLPFHIGPHQQVVPWSSLLSLKVLSQLHKWSVQSVSSVSEKEPWVERPVIFNYRLLQNLSLLKAKSMSVQCLLSEEEEVE